MCPKYRPQSSWNCTSANEVLKVDPPTSMHKWKRSSKTSSRPGYPKLYCRKRSTDWTHRFSALGPAERKDRQEEASHNRPPRSRETAAIPQDILQREYNNLENSVKLCKNDTGDRFQPSVTRYNCKRTQVCTHSIWSRTVNSNFIAEVWGK